MANLSEARRAGCERLVSNLHAARVRHREPQRHAARGLLPVLAAENRADADFLSGPIQAAVREEVGGERASFHAIAHATYVKARQIEVARLVGDRQERAFASAPREVQHRLLFALEAAQVREVHMPVGVRRPREHGHAVATQNLDVHASHRFAVADRLHEHFLRAIH